MAYKQKSSGLPFKQLGSSPAKQSDGVKKHLSNKTKEELKVIAERNLANLNKNKNQSDLDNIQDQGAIRDTLAGVRGRAIEIIKEGE